MSDISGHSSFLVLGNTASTTGMAADKYGWLTIAGRAMNNAGAPTSSKICSRTGNFSVPAPSVCVNCTSSHLVCQPQV